MKKSITIDLQGVTSLIRLHENLKRAFHLSDAYGANLDALYDVLTEIGMTHRILFRNVSPEIDILRRLSADAMAENPEIEIQFIE